MDLAAASGAVIVGFNTSMASGAKKAADATGVDVRDYDVIYKLLEDIQMAMEGLLEPELVEEALGRGARRVHHRQERRCGLLCHHRQARNCRVRVHRGKQVVYEATSTPCAATRTTSRKWPRAECGVGTDRFANWEEGDH